MATTTYRKSTNANQRCLAVTAAVLSLTLAAAAEIRADEIPVDTLLDKQARVGLAGFEYDEPHYWKQIGTGTIAGGDAERDYRDLLEKAAAADPEAFSKAAEAEPDEAPDRWIALNVETGVEYLVELPAEYLRQIGDAAVAAGVNEPYEGRAPSADEPEEPAGALAAKGWSNGVDTRTRRFNNTTYPYRAMGQINGGATSGCSGTLIGPRHVLTAAHCIWNKSTNTWYSFTFRPGREGTCGGASCQPYGAHGVIWYFTPVAYRTSSVANSWKHDYGIVTTANRPGNQTGWMGYVAVGAGTLKSHCNNGKKCKNRGYPACGFPEAPAGCQQGWAYQDTDYCQVANFRDKDGDGWNRRFDVDCDISRGHSGSALFSNNWTSANKKVVFGVCSTHICTTCSASQRWVNTFRRITPEVLDWISYFKTVKFP